MTKILFILLLTCLIFSCGRQTQSNGETASQTTDNIPSDPPLSLGDDVFKKNCAICHCPPKSNCEPSDIPTLQNIFTNLPKDSLKYFEGFVKNSADIRTNQYAPHEFGKTLSDSLIKKVIEHIWQTSKTK